MAEAPAFQFGPKEPRESPPSCPLKLNPPAQIGGENIQTIKFAHLWFSVPITYFTGLPPRSQLTCHRPDRSMCRSWRTRFFNVESRKLFSTEPDHHPNIEEPRSQQPAEWQVNCVPACSSEVPGPNRASAATGDNWTTRGSTQNRNHSCVYRRAGQVYSLITRTVSVD